MAIAYKSAGAGTATESSGGALSPACPATVDAGDILIAHVFWEGTTTAPSTPSGWDLLHGPEVIQSTIARHWVFGRVADGSEDGATVAFGSPAVTTQRGARIYSFSGRVSGAITGLCTGFSATSHATDPQMPTVTTTRAGALAVALVGQNDNNTVGNATGESGGNWTEAVAEFTANLTPGLMMQLQTATPDADPGTISGGAASTTNDPVGVIGFQIQDTVGTGDVLIRVGSAATVNSPEFTEDVDPDHTEYPDGFGTAAGLGTPAVTVSSTTSPTGQAVTAGLGTPVPVVAALPGGQSATAGLGTPSEQVDSVATPTGQAATAGLGTPTATGGSVVEPTGQEATAGLGTPAVLHDYTVTVDGFGLSADLGTPAVLDEVPVEAPPAPLGPPIPTRWQRRPIRQAPQVQEPEDTPAPQDAVVAVSGFGVQARVGTGWAVVDAATAPQGFGMDAGLGVPVVTGMHNPTDEQVVEWLLAALAESV